MFDENVTPSVSVVCVTESHDEFAAKQTSCSKMPYVTSTKIEFEADIANTVVLPSIALPLVSLLSREAFTVPSTYLSPPLYLRLSVLLI